MIVHGFTVEHLASASVECVVAGSKTIEVAQGENH